LILYHRTKLALEVIPVKLDDFTMNVNGVGGERLLLKNVARASESSAENTLPALCNPLPRGGLRKNGCTNGSARQSRLSHASPTFDFLHDGYVGPNAQKQKSATTDGSAFAQYYSFWARYCLLDSNARTVTLTSNPLDYESIEQWSCQRT
jgi:hypothetical protein